MPETPCEQAAIRLQHVYAGAVALRELLSDVLLASEAQLAAARAADPGRDGGARDYRALSALVQHGLEADLRHPDAGHREGFCRTLTDLLVMVVDGVLPGEHWDPIANTARSFELRWPSSTTETDCAESTGTAGAEPASAPSGGGAPHRR